MAGIYDEVDLPGGASAFSPPDLEEERRLGRLAAQLLDSEAYKTVTAKMRENAILSFSAAPLDDIRGLQWCRAFLKVLDDQDALLRDAVDTGVMADAQLTGKMEQFRVIGDAR